jgi:hypothetical protein
MIILTKALLILPANFAYILALNHGSKAKYVGNYTSLKMIMQSTRRLYTLDMRQN